MDETTKISLLNLPFTFIYSELGWALAPIFIRSVNLPLGPMNFLSFAAINLLMGVFSKGSNLLKILFIFILDMAEGKFFQLDKEAIFRNRGGFREKTVRFFKKHNIYLYIFFEAFLISLMVSYGYIKKILVN